MSTSIDFSSSRVAEPSFDSRIRHDWNCRRPSCSTSGLYRCIPAGFRSRTGDLRRAGELLTTRSRLREQKGREGRSSQGPVEHVAIPLPKSTWKSSSPPMQVCPILPYHPLLETARRCVGKQTPPERRKILSPPWRTSNKQVQLTGSFHLSVITSLLLSSCWAQSLPSSEALRCFLERAAGERRGGRSWGLARRKEMSSTCEFLRWDCLRLTMAGIRYFTLLNALLHSRCAFPWWLDWLRWSDILKDCASSIAPSQSLWRLLVLTLTRVPLKSSSPSPSPSSPSSPPPFLSLLASSFLSVLPQALGPNHRNLCSN
eukprot:768615-Hanusia_phi.AAC.2